MQTIENSPANLLHKDKKLLIVSFSITAVFVAIIWFVWLVDFLFNLNLAQFGVHPRSISGLRGILFMPYLHGNFQHLLSNTLPALILGTVLFNTYPKVAIRTILLIQLFSGLMVWMIGAELSYHIGASGVIFGIASFLFFSGFFRRDRQSIAISFFVGLLYGGSMILGMMPAQPGVSWEGHLSGAIVGLVCALFFKNIDIAKQEEFNDDLTENDDMHFFDPNNPAHIEEPKP